VSKLQGVHLVILYSCSKNSKATKEQQSTPNGNEDAGMIENCAVSSTSQERPCADDALKSWCCTYIHLRAVVNVKRSNTISRRNVHCHARFIVVMLLIVRQAATTEKKFVNRNGDQPVGESQICDAARYSMSTGRRSTSGFV
jgi:hypothetical protein